MKRCIFTSVLIISMAVICFSTIAETVTVEKPIEDISEIYYSCPGSLHIKQGDNESLKIKINKEHLDRLDIYTRGDSLYLKLKNLSGFFSSNNIRVDIYLTVKNIESFKNTSVGNSEIENLNVGNLDIKNLSTGRISLQGVECSELSVSVNSTGRVVFKGDVAAGDIDFKLGSTGKLEIEKITGKDMDLNLGSTGSFYAGNVSLTGDLDAKISSTGKVKIGSLRTENIDVTCSSVGNFYASLDPDSKQNSIELTTNSNGSIYIDGINADEVESSLRSSGEIELKGRTVEQKVSLSSSGGYSAEDLVTENTEVHNNGSATVRVNATKKFKLRATGSGSIYLKGEPKMSIHKIGSGSFVCEDNGFSV